MDYTSERGQRPLFYLPYKNAKAAQMITKEMIRKSVEAAIADTDIFIVDVTVGNGNKIFVEVDSPQGININDCKSVSKKIESDFDREQEDFELTVSSPGLERPFKVFEQYLKNIGRNVAIDLTDGTTLSGKLKNADENKIAVESVTKEKAAGSNKKEEVVHLHELAMESIKQIKVVISFK